MLKHPPPIAERSGQSIYRKAVVGTVEEISMISAKYVAMFMEQGIEVIDLGSMSGPKHSLRR
jgi:hypothetical protein